MSTAVMDPPRTGRGALSDWLVVGGCVLAPLNLLLVLSLTAYDVLLALALVDLVVSRRLRMPHRRYLVASYVFLLVAVLSAFRATYSVEALTQTLQYAFIFFVQVPVVVSVVRTRRHAVACVALLCLGTLLAILHSFLFRPTQDAGRVVVFYSENPNRLGYPAAYLLPLLLALWYLSRDRRLGTRIWVATGCAIGGYLAVWAVFASGSRSSLLGTVVALVVFVVVRPGHGIAGMLGRATALVAVIGTLGWALTSTGQLPGTLQERVDRSVGAGVDREDQAHLVGDREQLFDAGVHAFVDSPFIGTGLDNFRYVTTDYNLFATPQLPHNLWLQLLVQVGLIGAVAFAVYLLAWWRDVVACFRRIGPADQALLWAVAASLAGILTIFMFTPEMLDRHYWLIVALGLAVVRGTAAPPSIRPPAVVRAS